MNELEQRGLDTLKKMNLKCFGDLGHHQILKVFPDASVSPDEHFEFDYFVLYGTICLVGEMSGISDRSEIKKKYKAFQRNFSFLTSAKDNNFFDHFDIPPQDRYLFNQVRSLRAFFIANEHERHDLNLSSINNISVIYHGDWNTFEHYVGYMGKFAQYPFLKLISISGLRDIGKDLRFEQDKNKLIYEPDRVVANGTEVKADVFTFVAHPADLLTIAEVFRRELMPIFTVAEDNQYQRSLDFKKMKAMEKLVANSNFTFPNSILISLDKQCIYNHKEKKLIIPMEYGNISIIDGQHRLFSYANINLTEEIRENAKILVTAIRFQTTDSFLALQCCAKTFVEINTEQKRVSSDHINEIAYSVLGRKYPRALAAQVILRCNHRFGKALYGMFTSSQVTGGIFKAATVIESLAAITSLETISKLIQTKSGKRAKNKLGYLNLFDKDLEDLSDASTFIEQGVICLEHYFYHVKRIFREDWPKRNDGTILQETTLSYTKVFSAFIRLLNQFLLEGLNWEALEQELGEIRANIISIRKLPSNYNGIILKKDTLEIPDDQPSVSDTFKFLNKNRSKPTSISEI